MIAATPSPNPLACDNLLRLTMSKIRRTHHRKFPKKVATATREPYLGRLGPHLMMVGLRFVGIIYEQLLP